MYLLFSPFFLLSYGADGANAAYTPKSLIDKIVTSHISDHTTVYFNMINTAGINQKSIDRFERELTHNLLKKGYNVTYTVQNDASFRMTCEVLCVDSENSGSDMVLYSLITIERLPDNEIVFRKQVSAVVSDVYDDSKNVDVIANLNFLTGSESEFDNLSPGDNTESRTSSVNDRDMEIGVRAGFPHDAVTSVFTVRTDTGFGRDDFKIYRASFSYDYRDTSILAGVYPLKFGSGSRFLNASVEHPYFYAGILFDSSITGLALTRPYNNNCITVYCGANRNPSMAVAAQWEYSRMSSGNAGHFFVSVHGLYVNRDDDYNDIRESGGLELAWQRGEKLFLYGLFGVNHFGGSGVNIERQIIPVWGEYEYALSKRVILKGGYLALHEDVDGGERTHEETVFQEADYRISSRWMPGFQFKHAGIKGVLGK